MTSTNPRHRPNRFDKYQQIHDKYIQSFITEGFIDEKSLDYLKFAHDICEITLRGEIACLGQILITVDKDIKIVSGCGDAALVQTIMYEYNVSVRGYGNVFRYDNSHSRPGHPDNHHKHEFNWKLNELGEGRVRYIGEDGWPTLDQVIKEARDWYWSNKEELPKGFPQLGLR